MKTPDVIVFDVDGVLVEVTASYREAIRATVRHFTGHDVSHKTIQDFKNQGGWNNDWDLSQRLITDHGHGVTYDEVVRVFNQLFFGTNGDGLITRQEWIPQNGLLQTLNATFSLAIFTGRFRYELDATLQRVGGNIRFDPIVAADDVVNPKPAPEGLLTIQERYHGKHLW